MATQNNELRLCQIQEAEYPSYGEYIGDQKYDIAKLKINVQKAECMHPFLHRYDDNLSHEEWLKYNDITNQELWENIYITVMINCRTHRVETIRASIKTAHTEKPLSYVFSEKEKRTIGRAARNSITRYKCVQKYYKTE